VYKINNFGLIVKTRGPRKIVILSIIGDSTVVISSGVYLSLLVILVFLYYGVLCLTYSDGALEYAVCEYILYHITGLDFKIRREQSELADYDAFHYATYLRFLDAWAVATILFLCYFHISFETEPYLPYIVTVYVLAVVKMYQEGTRLLKEHRSLTPNGQLCLFILEAFVWLCSMVLAIWQGGSASYFAIVHICVIICWLCIGKVLAWCFNFLFLASLTVPFHSFDSLLDFWIFRFIWCTSPYWIYFPL